MPFDIKTHAEKFLPFYGEHEFADHLPMTVVALRKLGAREETIDNFVSVYAKRLKRKKIPAKSIDPLLLSAHYGDPAIYPKAFRFFLNAIETDGRVDVLATYLPELIDAISTAAFHGVIRTAYGLLANEDTEIAAGLAYWWSRAEKVSYAMSIGAANNDVETLIADVASAFEKNRKKLKLDQPTISARIAEIFSHPRIASVLTRAAAADVKFDAIASTALRIYLASEDFTALHCVTGVHAARILSEHVVMDDIGLRKALWGAICAAYASIGAPPLPPLSSFQTKSPNWRIISAAAQSSVDEHDIKFVYACREEARQYGRDAQYRHAAAKRMALSGA